ncbi:MAG: glucosamine-6-phosphate deaminase, partial [Planctomycetota bacterium]
ALTVGVGTVMDAREVVILASGHSKARALEKTVEEGLNHMWTVSALQTHRKGMIVCDDDATVELKVGTVNYFKDIEKDHLEPVAL